MKSSVHCARAGPTRYLVLDPRGLVTEKNKKMFTQLRLVATKKLSSVRHLSFTYPAPRTLNEVVKLELFAEEKPEKIREIWNEYHENRDDAIGSFLSPADHTAIQERGKQKNMFVFPVLRDDGHFQMLSQVHGKHVVLTMLDEYRLNGANAQPWLSLTFYDELVEKKDLVLVRGDVLVPQLSLEEGERLWGNVRHFYLNEPEQVDMFNNRPREFDIEAHLARDFATLV